ncbi:MAG TPA: cobalt-precorrin-6A reductase [Dongiaceae bacterium]|nr:cobalt-precorrin-6A reductase [Dongiaceae bacterium]
MKRILILGGTQEGYALAERLADVGGIEVISSLAGRTLFPRRPKGQMRVGGFGGPEGLARYLRAEKIAHLINATHPFADQISANAVDAAHAAGVPLLRLLRPGWRARAEDRWIMARHMAEAAELCRREGGRIFLTTGSNDLAAFAEIRNAHFVVRVVDAPETVPLHDYATITARGPFSLQDELALMAAHHVNLLVTKNSGGDATSAKLEAARRLRLPVIMVERPQIALEPRSPVAEDVEAAIAHLLAAL